MKLKLLDSILSKKPPKKLYHYTTANGIVGIFTTKTIWATNIHHLNDSTEFTYAIDLTNSLIEELYSESENKEILEYIQNYIKTVRKVHVSVISLTKDPDLLSMWRAYSNHTNGYSLGFTVDLLKPIMEKQGLFLAPCIYKKEDQIQLLTELLESTIELYTQLRSRSFSEDEIKQACYSAFFTNFFKISPLLKHPTFVDENEWRMVSKLLRIDDPNWGFRVANSVIIPHYFLNLSYPEFTHPIKTIYIGPNANPELAKETINFLLYKMLPVNPDGTYTTYSEDNDGIHPTKIPYRLL